MTDVCVCLYLQQDGLLEGLKQDEVEAQRKVQAELRRLGDKETAVMEEANSTRFHFQQVHAQEVTRIKISTLDTVMFTCTCIGMFIHMHTGIHTHTQTRLHTHGHTNRGTIHTHTHTFTHAHTHITKGHKCISVACFLALRVFSYDSLSWGKFWSCTQ